MPARGLINRVCGEYREMPGLRLTVPQACRLWQVDRALCETVMRELIGTGFLVQMRDGSYVSAGLMRGNVQLAAKEDALTAVGSSTCHLPSSVM